MGKKRTKEIEAGVEAVADDAFAVYVALGEERSYELVARHLGLTKRTVCRRAAAENWQPRLAAMPRSVIESVEEELERQRVERARGIEDAISSVITPDRLKGLLVSLYKSAVKDGNIRAAAILLDRALGKVRSEGLSPHALDIPDGLEKSSDVRRAANSILQAMADGSLAPEDAQRAAAVLEAARRSVETDELAARITELEDQVARRGGR